VIRGRAFAAVAVALGCVAQTSAPTVPPSGEQILGRAKAAFRAHPQPPFIVYVLDRSDTTGGLPDAENSYTLKIWCRTADRAALTRTLQPGRPEGQLVGQTVAFDGRVDPGPPNADIFERALYGRSGPAHETPSPSPALPTIGAIVVQTDFDYRVLGVSLAGDAYDLLLAPKRDPARNRIDELWVDAATFEIRRMRVRDHLYLAFTGLVLDDELDVRFSLRDGLPLIASIHGETADGVSQSDYTYRDITFPATLPDWYFEPQTYAAHRADAPT
jgi:hypothetical protein